MDKWLEPLRIDPLPSLPSGGTEPLAYFVRRDLLDEPVGSIEELWELPDALKIVKKQQEDGSWHYPGKEDNPYGSNYDLLEAFRQLRFLVAMYGFNRQHPALQKAADYVSSCQTEEGDIRGIIGNQYAPYYHAAILELLIKAGYEDDERVEKGLDWLLSVRQDDGGWLIPMQAVPSKERSVEMWRGAPVPPDRSRPHAHLATGMVLRAFAAHPHYRRSKEARVAGERLKERFFKADKYNDRKTTQYWTKFQYPFWWTDILSALDSLSLIGFSADDADVQGGLHWFASNQEESGLWPTGYGKGPRAETQKLWVGLAVCRVFKRFVGGQSGSRG